MTNALFDGNLETVKLNFSASRFFYFNENVKAVRHYGLIPQSGERKDFDIYKMTIFIEEQFKVLYFNTECCGIRY
ncbi:MAG: hypothetical protein ACJA1N_001308 [Saprospiraceae bacterium]